MVILCAGCTTTAKTADTRKAPVSRPPASTTKATRAPTSAPVAATARKPAKAVVARKPVPPPLPPAVPLKPVTAPVAVRGDEDGDRVPDTADRCHATLRGLRVDQQGCFISQRRSLGLDLFQGNTAMLTPAARKMLLGLAGSVKFQLDATVVLSAVASGQGDLDFRIKLAQQRIESVRQTLIARGIPKARIRAERNGATRTPPGKLELRLVIG